MDDVIAALCSLLREKQTHFTEYETLTQQMLSCPQEELVLCTDRREHLIKIIDNLDRQIHQTAEESGEPAEQMDEAIHLRCNRSDLPERYQPLFDEAMQVCGIANRVQRLEPLIADRIEEELDLLLERIKENNRSVSAQAARFSMPGPDAPSLLSSHSRKA